MTIKLVERYQKEFEAIDAPHKSFFEKLLYQDFENEAQLTKALEGHRAVIGEVGKDKVIYYDKENPPYGWRQIITILGE